MKIQLVLVTSFWTQLIYNLRHCGVSQPGSALSLLMTKQMLRLILIAYPTQHVRKRASVSIGPAKKGISLPPLSVHIVVVVRLSGRALDASQMSWVHIPSNYWSFHFAQFCFWRKRHCDPTLTNWTTWTLALKKRIRWHLFISTVCAGWIFQYHAVFETEMNTVYSFSSEGEMFPITPYINRSSVTRRRMAAAITQFARGSTKLPESMKCVLKVG